MSEELQFVLNDNGLFEEYDDKYDVTIHCETEEEQEDVLRRLSMRWIPVTEKLPEENGDYLVTFKLSFMNFIEICTFNKAAWDKGGYDEVIAWMPLPPSYQGESEEKE